MVKYARTSAVAKQGVNFIRSAVEGAGSIFHKIENENDLGVDCLIELVLDEKPLNRQVAVQIKSGNSYYRASKEECHFEVGSHRDYWLHHQLPVLGLVFIPALERAHWIDVKYFLRQHPESNMIKYVASNANKFDGATFGKLFVPALLGKLPALSFAEAILFFESKKVDEFNLGLNVLFRQFPNVLEVWDRLIQCFFEKSIDDLPRTLMYYFAHIPWHGDILGYGEQVTEVTRSYVKKFYAAFEKAHVVKLLSFIDVDAGISRGSVGQSVDAIISSLPESAKLLSAIVLDESIETFVREYAAMILAKKQGKTAMPVVQRLASGGSWCAKEIVEQLSLHGYVDLY